MKSLIVYEIYLCLTDQEVDQADIILLRKFTGLPLGELWRSCGERRVYLGKLFNEEFYSGVNEMLILLRNLKSSFRLYNGSLEIDIKLLKSISEQVEKVSLGDIR